MRLTLCILSCVFFASCASRLTRDLGAIQEKFQDNTGFMLYDPAAKKVLAEFNSKHYFLPASNTKILTLYTSLRILGDSIPAFRYAINEDSLILWGTGDPSFLNKRVFNNNRVYNFLQHRPQRLFIAPAVLTAAPWGPGWAWDDFPNQYSAERSAFPVYGNVQLISFRNQKFRFIPRLFQNHLIVVDSIEDVGRMVRELESNQVTFSPGRKPTQVRDWELTFHHSSDALVEMLSDTLLRQVEETPKPLPLTAKTFYSIPSDSLYAPMMKYSDNMIAEHLLLLCAQKLSDTLDADIAIRFARKNFLGDLPDALVWVDGSGLSRYNLNTPRNIVRVWEKLYAEIPRQRLFALLAVGGQTGTLRNYYKTAPPFIFGKTGGFSNNISLSGYLITKKGKVLVFSFMNSNFTVSGQEVRGAMERILTSVRDNY